MVWFVFVSIAFVVACVLAAPSRRPRPSPPLPSPAGPVPVDPQIKTPAATASPRHEEIIADTRCGGPEGETGLNAEGGDISEKTSEPVHNPTAESSARQAWSLPIASLLKAIRQVESSGDDRAIGDGGRSRGPYQIGRAYWSDGGGDRGRYDSDVWDAELCRPVIIGYWRRFCPAALKTVAAEKLARVHNGGPRGDRIAATEKYWKRVSAALAVTACGVARRGLEVAPTGRNQGARTRNLFNGAVGQLDCPSALPSDPSGPMKRKNRATPQAVTANTNSERRRP